MKDSGWPIMSSRFIPQEPLELRGVGAVYSIYLPLNTFVENATLFADVEIDKENKKPLVSIAWFQFWIFCLGVFQRRMECSSNAMDKYPVSVVLEKVYEEPVKLSKEAKRALKAAAKTNPNGAAAAAIKNKQKRVLGYSLHIFQQPTDETLSLALIFKDAVLTNKVVDAQGFFSGGNVALAGSSSKGGPGGGAGAPKTTLTNIADALHPDGKGNPSGDFHYQYYTRKNRQPVSNLFTLYKNIHGRSAFNNVVDAYCGCVRASGSTQASLSNDHINPTLFFDLPQALMLRPTNCCRAQRLLATYQQNLGSESVYVFQDIESFYILPPHMWDVTYIMSRMLPHVQFNEMHLRFSARLLRYSKAIDEREALAAANAAAAAAAKIALENPTDGEEPAAAAAARADVPAFFRQHVESGGLGEGEEGGFIRMQIDEENQDNFRVVTDDLADMFFKVAGDGRKDNEQEDVIPISADAIADITEFFGFMEHCKKDDEDAIIDIDDKVTQMRAMHQMQAQIITRMHEPAEDATEEEKEDMLQKRLRDRQQLRKVMYEKYARDMVHKTSDTSKAQRELNEYFQKHNLREKAVFKMPIFDAQMPAWEQFVVYLTEGFTKHCDVATGARFITFGYISMSGRFAIERKLHPYVVFSGVAGQGKSNQIGVVGENILKSSCTNILRTSKQNDSVSGASYDEVVITDDLSWQDLAEDGEKLAMQKSIATSAENSGSRLMQVKKPDGTIEFKSVHYTNVIMRSQMAGINSTGTSFVTAAKQHGSSVSAYLSRLTFLDYPKMNTHRPIHGSRAAKAQKDEIDKLLDKRFVDRNIGLHCILGHAWKQYYIGIMHLDMSLFEIVYTQFEEILKNMAVKLVAEHERVHEQAWLFCRCLPFITAFVDNHLVSTGPHFGKPFDIMQMMDWNPICTVDHVIFTFSFFLPHYYPEAMDPVIAALREIMVDSFQLKDKKVGYQQKPENATERFEKYNKQILNATNAQMVQTGKALRDALQRQQQQQARPHPPAPPPPPPPAPANPQPQRDVPNEEELSRMMEDGDLQGLQPAPAVPAPAPAPPPPGGAAGAAPAVAAPPPAGGVGAEPPLDATYVVFNYTLEELQQLITMRLAGKTVEHSACAITEVLSSLQKAEVRSRPYCVATEDCDSPVLNSAITKEFPQRGVIMSKSGAGIMVHYALMDRDTEYEGILRKVLNTYSHKHFIKRKVLTGMSHPEYPWLFQTINVEPTPDRTLQIMNHSYVCPSTFTILTGTDEYDKVARPYQKSLLREFSKCDEDMYALFSYFSSAPWAGNIEAKEAVFLHWAVQQQRINDDLVVRIVTEDKSATNGLQPSFIVYPDTLIKEMNAVAGVHKYAISRFNENRPAVERNAQGQDIIRLGDMEIVIPPPDKIEETFELGRQFNEEVEVNNTINYERMISGVSKTVPDMMDTQELRGKYKRAVEDPDEDNDEHDDIKKMMRVKKKRVAKHANITGKVMNGMKVGISDAELSGEDLTQLGFPKRNPAIEGAGDEDDEEEQERKKKAEEEKVLREHADMMREQEQFEKEHPLFRKAEPNPLFRKAEPKADEEQGEEAIGEKEGEQQEPPPVAPQRTGLFDDMDIEDL